MDSPDLEQELDTTASSFHLGSFVSTPANNRLFLVSCCQDGNTSIVYKCVDQHNHVVALKTIRESSPKFYKSIQNELRKANMVSALDIGVPKVLECGKNYCVREWCEGVRGDVWYNQWKDFGCSVENEGFLALVALWKAISGQGFYVQNLKQLNMIWTASGWVVIDSGYRRTGKPELCMLRFCHHFDKHWQNQEENIDITPIQYILEKAGLYEWDEIEATTLELEELFARRKAEKEFRNSQNALEDSNNTV